MNRITKTERRFLIIWIAACCFAFIVNIADIKGCFDEGNGPIRSASRPPIESGEKTRPAQYLFTTGEKEEREKFWPFTTTFFEEYKIFVWDRNYGLIETGEKMQSFRGIFNGFDYIEFVVYILLAAGIVIVRKLW